MYDYIPNHRIFISYHHHNDQVYKNAIINKFAGYIFTDMSVDTGDINEDLTDERIRQIIRDDYLKDSTVTVVLVGTETKHRKHVDWEVYSSMFDGTRNKKSGILVINLPTVNGRLISICDEDKEIMGQSIAWSPITSYENYEYLPKRILDNIKKNDVKIAVADYSTIIDNPEGFKKLIDIAYNNRTTNNYDLSERMRRRNG